LILGDIIGRWKKMEKNTKMIIIKTDDLKPDEFVKLLDVLRVNRE
jgi:hypothetical protein